MGKSSTNCIESKNKLGFIDGTVTRPEESKYHDISQTDHGIWQIPCFAPESSI